MKLKTFTLTILVGLGFSTTTLAAEQKTISLKDGSSLKGEVVSLNNGVYKIKTNDLGEMQINKANVSSISSGQVMQQQTNQQAQQNPANMHQQVEKMKGVMLSDPALMQDMQKLLADEEIKTILSDPSLVQDVMSYDPQRMMGNEKMMKLMNNPQMKAFINKAAENFVPQQQQQK